MSTPAEDQPPELRDGFRIVRLVMSINISHTGEENPKVILIIIVLRRGEPEGKGEGAALPVWEESGADELGV